MSVFLWDVHLVLISPLLLGPNKHGLSQVHTTEVSVSSYCIGVDTNILLRIERMSIATILDFFLDTSSTTLRPRSMLVDSLLMLVM